MISALYHCPPVDLDRSPVARRITEAASASRLFLSHFEHRTHLPPADDWIPFERPDLTGSVDWVNGSLTELKYQGFRTDQMIGAMHPGQSGKWTTHELLHRLVGFGWHPGLTEFELSLYARAAELLPVAVYYFLDEDGLNRCERHQSINGPYVKWCSDCEAAAAEKKHIARPIFSDLGHQFISTELSALRESAAIGRPVYCPNGSIDLCSDSLAYAAAQIRRLQSSEFQHYAKLFFKHERGWHSSLDSMIGRVEQVASMLMNGTSLPPWKATVHDWIKMDLAWRFIEVAKNTSPAQTNEVFSWLTVYREKTVDEWILNFPEFTDESMASDVICAVGYPLPGHPGIDAMQVIDGLTESMPLTMKEVDDDLIADFLAQDVANRRRLPDRFSSFLQLNSHPLGGMARMEFRIRHPEALRDSDLLFQSEPYGTARKRMIDQITVDADALLAYDIDLDVTGPITVWIHRGAGDALLITVFDTELLSIYTAMGDAVHLLSEIHPRLIEEGLVEPVLA